LFGDFAAGLPDDFFCAAKIKTPDQKLLSGTGVPLAGQRRNQRRPVLRDHQFFIGGITHTELSGRLMQGRLATEAHRLVPSPFAADRH
jgi:hypothetical protein